MLDRIFKRSKRGETAPLPPAVPPVVFGHYSDNNKPVQKVEKWNASEASFKQKNYKEAIRLFFEYLGDEEIENVVHEPDEKGGRFYLYQGSILIKGYYDTTKLEAEAALAVMPQPSTPVMRRLLELNFNLYYSRYALKENTLRLMFTTDIETASPGKLYYGLKELATQADKQDDLLIQEFTALTAIDTTHIEPVPEEEKEVKYSWFKKWIDETLELIAGADADKFSGGISYLLLALAFRIDFLISPAGKLQEDLKKIVTIYFRKDAKPVIGKNGEMTDAFIRLKAKTKTEFFSCLFRSRYTFSPVNPQPYKNVADTIYNANQNIAWYKENKQEAIAAQISEYGLSYCQYYFSLPRPVTQLFLLLMMVNYPDYFRELGFGNIYYDKEAGGFNKENITAYIETVQQQWKEKYPQLYFKTDRLRYDSLVTFNETFTTEIEGLNLETK